jgi:hypothetical protein
VTRAQARASKAFECIRRVSGDSDLKKSYAPLCQRSPDILRRSGLLQGLCFLQTRSKGRSEYGKAFVGDLAAVLAAGAPPGTSASLDALLQRARTAPMREYMALTRDVVDAALWLRRFNQSEMPDVGNDGENG